MAKPIENRMRHMKKNNLMFAHDRSKKVGLYQTRCEGGVEVEIDITT
jgi:hypothetical protein